MINIEGVYKSYDTLVAVNDFHLEIEPGSTLGLIGPNGSGKTTLLRMISTLAKPDRGRITINGVDSREKPYAIRRRLGFMPAEFGVPGHMNIGEYMEYFACAAGIARKDRPEAIGDILELTDLAGREDVNVRGLSTGNKQRLLLAKTLLGDPDLLVLDEPASGLDPRARVEVRCLLKELSSMGKTIIVSSHILADLEDICSGICIIEEGKRVAAGNITDLREGMRKPHRFVHLMVRPSQSSVAYDSLNNLEGVMNCELFADKAGKADRLEISSMEANCNYILRALLAADVEILEMREEIPDLEDIFFDQTKGVVS
ncbi:MAG: ABC transporter ATP-binding protein [Planctomycetes bacterium]|nr:ABC transporter ATP-binding protein [Planctomycetota bacterium]